MSFLATLLSRAYIKTQTPKSWICLCSVENYINLMFNLAQMSAILDFTRNAMSKNTFWPHLYMSSVLENPWEDTQIINHYILLKLYKLIVWLCTNAGHFISAYLQVSVSILTFFLLCGNWRPFWKMLIMLRPVCKTIKKKNWNQLIITFNLSLFVGLYLAFAFFTVFTLWLVAISEICKLG